MGVVINTREHVSKQVLHLQNTMQEVPFPFSLKLFLLVLHNSQIHNITVIKFKAGVILEYFKAKGHI